ncbi:hypothetical protein K490DRAFT_58443 [Saccharata proteae CBS 121410]|uniref:Uncharacterized protein n=1 Tax=Saccharata proteae CBS 121410 TaxID=1314787 RepID=A0A9P4HSD1_9PEZI|nr:hypothetical protein K490DRAFT_58443 [Saccharata proteae CBS 121410]
MAKETASNVRASILANTERIAARANGKDRCDDRIFVICENSLDGAFRAVVVQHPLKKRDRERIPVRAILLGPGRETADKAMLGLLKVTNDLLAASAPAPASAGEYDDINGDDTLSIMSAESTRAEIASYNNVIEPEGRSPASSSGEHTGSRNLSAFSRWPIRISSLPNFRSLPNLHEKKGGEIQGTPATSPNLPIMNPAASRREPSALRSHKPVPAHLFVHKKTPQKPATSSPHSRNAPGSLRPALPAVYEGPSTPSNNLSASCGSRHVSLSQSTSLPTMRQQIARKPLQTQPAFIRKAFNNRKRDNPLIRCDGELEDKRADN